MDKSVPMQPFLHQQQADGDFPHSSDLSKPFYWIQHPFWETLWLSDLTCLVREIPMSSYQHPVGTWCAAVPTTPVFLGTGILAPSHLGTSPGTPLQLVTLPTWALRCPIALAKG